MYAAENSSYPSPIQCNSKMDLKNISVIIENENELDDEDAKSQASLLVENLDLVQHVVDISITDTIMDLRNDIES